MGKEEDLAELTQGKLSKLDDIINNLKNNYPCFLGIRDKGYVLLHEGFLENYGGEVYFLEDLYLYRKKLLEWDCKDNLFKPKLIKELDNDIAPAGI
ncbi:MAG: hypothetical protein PHT54_00730 [Candidatus Nanoarchaeia archaeon]|nr:hypothetical protein [Candidatus Nanoarchaeia archaeon]